MSEVRLFFSDTENLLGISQNKKGMALNFDPRYVISEVYLSPFGGDSFNESFLEMLADRYDWLAEKIMFSEILDS